MFLSQPSQRPQGDGLDGADALQRLRSDAIAWAGVVTIALVAVTLLVREYDEAIEYFTSSLGFKLLEDSPLPDGKRWVVVAPDGSPGLRVLLARAATPTQESAIGNQTGGRVGFFLHTTDFRLSYAHMRERGVEFLENPRSEPYGTVAVFADLYGNRWDLIEPLQAGEGR